MGFIVKQPILCNRGQLDEFYVAIENYSIRKNEGMLWLTVACFENASGSKNNYNLYLNPKTGSGQSDVIGVSINYNGQELEYSTFFTFPLTGSIEIEEPIMAEQINSQSISYYDFDENGDVVEKERIEYTSQSIQIGTNIVTKYIPNINQITGSIFEHSYSLVKEEFGRVFGYENIVDKI